MRDHAGMRSAIPYRILLVVGALASLAHLPLALPAGRALDLLRNGDVLVFVAFYVAGAFAYLKRPDHPVARWLLVFGVCLTTALALGSALSWAIVLKPGASWLWAGNALEQAVEVAGLAAWVAAFALFPDGVYHRPYERWAVRASFLLVPLIPALLVLTLPTLYLNDNFFWATPGLPNPLFIPALAWLGPVAPSPPGGRGWPWCCWRPVCWRSAIAGCRPSSGCRRGGRCWPCSPSGWSGLGRSVR